MFYENWLAQKTLICLYQREMSKGRRRRKRKCRRMFSQSEGKIGATENTLLSGFFVIWKLISLRTGPHCPKVIMSAIPDRRNFLSEFPWFEFTMAVPGSAPPKRKEIYKWGKYFPRTFTLCLNITSSDTRRHGQYSAWTGRWGRTRGSDWLLAPLSRSTTTRSRLSGKAQACIACRPIETFFDIKCNYIFSLDEDTSEFTAKSTFDHPYPTTKIMWIPDSKVCHQSFAIM